jgi:hypothetical protein
MSISIYYTIVITSNKSCGVCYMTCVCTHIVCVSFVSHKFSKHSCGHSQVVFTPTTLLTLDGHHLEGQQVCPPGLVDLDKGGSQQQAPRWERSLQTKASISKIGEFEKKLLTEQQERSANARNPPGPSVTKQAHTRPLSTDERVSPVSNIGSIQSQGA